MELLIVQFSLLSCYFIPLRSSYPPKHPVLRHLQSVPPLTSIVCAPFLVCDPAGCALHCRTTKP
jgi:hypothetical protein